MNLDTWIPYYKLDKFQKPCHTQMAYEPLMNPEGTVLCMNFDVHNAYQDYVNRLGFIPKISYEFFEREKYFLEKFSHCSWAPEIIEIKSDKIFIEWNRITCNDTIFLGQQLPAGWKEQLKSLIKDQIFGKVYKLSLYPHCHFFNKQGTLKTFDFYMSCDFDDSKMSYEKLEGIIHQGTMPRISEASTNQVLDMKQFFLKALEKHVQWPDNFLTSVYKEVVEYV